MALLTVGDSELILSLECNWLTTVAPELTVMGP